MEKLLNIIKYNTYGMPSLIDKYVFMELHDINNDIYFIFQIKEILNATLPYKYSCNRLYVLNIPKNKKEKAYLYDNLTEIELLYNDTLFQISFTEYLNYFKSFIDISDTTKKNLSI